MTLKTIVAFTTLTIACVNAYAVTLNDSSYTYRIFAPAGVGDSLAVDALGNVYAPTSAFNLPLSTVMRYAPDGSGRAWSGANGFGISIGANRVAYLAQRGLSPTKIQRIELDGTYRALEGSAGQQFTWTAVSNNNEVFANIWAGTGSGIYSINTITGASTLAATIPDAYYGSLTFGPDGQLYAVVGQQSGASVMRVSGNALVPFASLPSFGFGLTFAPDGDFFVSSPGGANLIYKYEASNQTVSNFASGLNSPSGLGYDSVRDILYVREQSGSIYAFDKISAVPEPTPLLSILIGIATMTAVKTLRRRKHAKET